MWKIKVKVIYYRSENLQHQCSFSNNLNLEWNKINENPRRVFKISDGLNKNCKIIVFYQISDIWNDLNKCEGFANPRFFIQLNEASCSVAKTFCKYETKK